MKNFNYTFLVLILTNFSISGCSESTSPNGEFSLLQISNGSLSVDIVTDEPIGTDIATLVEPCPGQPGGGGCAANETAIEAQIKCHTCASQSLESIQCVVKYDVDCSKNKKISGTITTWLNPSGREQSPVPQSCANVGLDSLIARLSDAPLLNGQYHFDGTVKGCVPKDKVCDQKEDCHPMVQDGLTNEILQILTESHAPRVSVASVRKGNQNIALGTSTSDPNTLFCVDKGNH